MHNIVIEGVDASGKSTLANFLSIKLRMPVKESEGPTRHITDFLERTSRYEQLENTIIVRHPHVSESIYGTARGTYDAYTKDPRFQESLGRYAQLRPLTIHCMPPTISLHHKIKAHDTDDHIKLLQTHKHAICGLYRAWAQLDADFHYQIGYSMHRLLSNITKSRFDPFNDIARFHEKFQLPAYPSCTIPASLAEFRANFMLEEAEEYRDAATAAHYSPDDSLIVDSLDALVDLVYIALGTSYLHGFNLRDIFAEAWRRVHRANMQKQRSLNSSHDSVRGSTWDVVKPEGWVAPCLDDLVERE